MTTRRALTIGLCIPTLNPGRWVDPMVQALRAQRLQPDRVLVIDSESTDGAVARFSETGAEILPIARDDFDHGATRNLGARHLGTDIVIYLTQDAIPADEASLEALVAALLEDDVVGIAYGRQLPHAEAGPLARVHRAFNYPPESNRRSADDIGALGVRAAFASNSFAAYRTEALESIGGFPARLVGSEDRWAAARLLQAGREIAYVSRACVFHSHDYSLTEQFRRYFDIGVFHASEEWFDRYLGRPDSEGVRLVQSQAAALRTTGASFARARVVSHAGAGWLGFKAGRLHRHIPRWVARRLSTAPAYFSAASRR